MNSPYRQDNLPESDKEKPFIDLSRLPMFDGLKYSYKIKTCEGYRGRKYERFECSIQYKNLLTHSIQEPINCFNEENFYDLLNSSIDKKSIDRLEKILSLETCPRPASGLSRNIVYKCVSPSLVTSPKLAFGISFQSFYYSLKDECVGFSLPCFQDVQTDMSYVDVFEKQKTYDLNQDFMIVDKEACLSRILLTDKWLNKNPRLIVQSS